MESRYRNRDSFKQSFDADQIIDHALEATDDHAATADSSHLANQDQAIAGYDGASKTNFFQTAKAKQVRRPPGGGGVSTIDWQAGTTMD